MEQAQQWVDQGRTQLPHPPEYYESLLEGPFVALDGTPKTFSDLTEVKYYLKQRFSRVSSQQRMSYNRKLILAHAHKLIALRYDHHIQHGSDFQWVYTTPT